MKQRNVIKGLDRSIRHSYHCDQQIVQLNIVPCRRENGSVFCSGILHL